MSQHLLPANATPIMVAAVQAADPTSRMLPAIERIRGWKHHNPPASLLPWLVDEYGLGELSPYLPNLTSLISEGVDWQRIRGTPAAVAMGLGFIGRAGTIEENPSQRRWWNAFALALASIPPESDLDKIDGIASLSVPLRSDFRRGFRGYDVRVLETGRSRLGRAQLGSDSGIRLRPNGPRWSFGRSYQATRALTNADMVSIGIDFPLSGPVGWDDVTWDEADYSWGADWQDVRLPLILRRLVARAFHFRLATAAGATIGFLRAAARISGGKIVLYGQTPFGLADANVAQVSIIIGGQGTGASWLSASALSGGTAFTTTLPAFSMRRTVREKITIEVTA
jgi:hypothetical protein